MLKTQSLSLSEARSIALHAQGMHAGELSPAEIFERLKWIQIDTISVVRRSHELILLARGASLGSAVGVSAVAAPIATFEYFAHALSLVPLKYWPHFSFRRRRMMSRVSAIHQAALDEVRALLAAHPVISSAHLDPTQGSGWNRTSPHRAALMYLVRTGEAVCSERVGWRRTYSLASKAVPKKLLKQDLSDEECVMELVTVSLDALGVGSLKDIADYARLPLPEVSQALKKLEFKAVKVESWKEKAWLSSKASPLPAGVGLDSGIPLSPFDSLVWYRARFLRLFESVYTFEAYITEKKRAFGYFTMPILYGERVIGQIAPRKRGQVLEIEAAEVTSDEHRDAVLSAVQKLLLWTGCDRVKWLKPL